MKVQECHDNFRAFPIAAADELIAPGPLLIVAPHPDDETLGVGGLITKARTAGQHVDIALLTDGAASHRGSKRYPPERLAALRRTELAAACSLMGVATGNIHHFDYPDSGLPAEGTQFNEAVDRLTALAVKIEARSMFVTWEHDPHCDHQAAARIAEAAQANLPGVQLYAYPIWGWHLPIEKELNISSLRGRRIDIGSVRHVKAKAIAAHASQMTRLISDDPTGFSFTETTLAPFLGRYEYLIECSHG